MKKFINLIILVFFVISITSCGSSVSVKKESQYQVAGYTLKNKKEIMQQKILNKKAKTIITGP